MLDARGLHPMSRLHLFSGIGAYATAPLWLQFLLVGILIALQAQFVRPEYFPRDFLLFPQWPAQDPVRAAWVFAGTLGLLLLQKLLAHLSMVAQTAQRRAFGGAARSLVSLLLESVVAGLMAPVTMLNQSITVVAALAGRDVGWNVQRRGEVDIDLVVGLARLEDARTPQEARQLLSDRELGALLSDPRGFERLMAIRELPPDALRVG